MKVAPNEISPLSLVPELKDGLFWCKLLLVCTRMAQFIAQELNRVENLIWSCPLICLNFVEVSFLGAKI